MRKIVKVGDIIVALIAFLVAAIIAFFPSLKKSEYVVIYVDGVEYAQFALTSDTDKRLDINTEFGHNTVVIKDSKVFVTDSSCENKLEISAGAISKAGQSLVCAPNRLVITIKGGDKLDASTF